MRRDDTRGGPSRRELLTWIVGAPLAARALWACDGASAAGSADTSAGADTSAADTSTADTSAGADTALGADTSGDTSPAVEACEPTLGDAQGPFYQPDAPSRAALAGDDEPGDALAIEGRVLDEACRPIADAVVEVWQADAAGDYHDDRLRATLAADADGGYGFTTIRPGRYLQASGYRPAHIHYRVSAPGYRPVVTQLYFEGDPYLSPEDSCGSCGSDDPGRIVPLVADGGTLVGAFDVVLERA